MKSIKQNILWQRLAENEKQKAKQDLEQVVARHPTLNFQGYNLEFKHPKLSLNVKRLAEQREILLSQAMPFYAACIWIQNNLQPRKSINYKWNSYNLKHLCEKETDYISSGTFTAAALHCGYKIRGKFQLHPYWNMSSFFKRN